MAGLGIATRNGPGRQSLHLTVPPCRCPLWLTLNINPMAGLGYYERWGWI